MSSDARSAADLRRFVIGNVTVAFVLRVGGTGLGFFLNLFLAKWLGVAAYGSYSYATSWLEMLVVMGAAGLTTATLRLVPEYSGRGRIPLLRGVVRRSQQVALAGGILVTVVAVAPVLMVSESHPTATVLLALLAIGPGALRAVQSSLLQGFERIGWSLAPQAVLEPLVIGAVCAAAIGLGVHFGSATAVLARDAALMVTVVLNLLLLGRERRSYQPGPVEYRTLSWLQLAFPMLLISGSLILLNRTDIVMVGAIRGQEEAGIYAVATRIASLVVFGLTAVNTVIAPRVARLFHNGSHDELQRILRLAGFGIALLAVPLLITLALLGETILGLFGPEFREGYPALMILIAGQAVNALSGSVGVVLNMTGHERTTAWVFGGAAVLNVALNAVLVPSLGLYGAAVGTAVTTILWNVCLVILVRRRLGLRATAVGL